MAMVKVCDICGAPIINGGMRILAKADKCETASIDLCDKCGTNLTDWVKSEGADLLPKPITETK